MGKNNSLPNQTVSETDKKTDDWIQGHFDYADQLCQALELKNEIFTKQLIKLNGETDKDRYKSLIESKGTDTSRQFIDYRWAYSKLKVVNNEYLKRPLPTYVYTRNKYNIQKKEDLKNQVFGMYANKELVQHLRKIGINLFNGSRIPENEEELKAATEKKTNNERIFSQILKRAIDVENLKVDFARNHMHIITGMRCFGRVELLSNGRVVYTTLDPRDEIAEHHENDPFRKRSQIMGSRSYMTSSEIVQRYGRFMSKDQIQNIYDKDQVAGDDLHAGTYYRYEKNSKQLEHLVTHIEWKTKKITYWKISEDKKDPGMPYRIEIEDYENTKEKHKLAVSRGVYKIEKDTDDDLMEGVRLSNDIVIMSGYKKYSLPDKVFTYYSLEIDNFDGRTVSLVDLTDEVSFMLNTVQMQIREIIRKYKGSAIFYDAAYLPKEKDTNDILYDIVEDSLVEFNSRAAGNQSSSNSDGKTGITVQHFNELADVQQLIMLKRDLKNDLEEITAINKERQGDSMASSTATAVRQNMGQSRVMTYHLNLFTDLFVRGILNKYVEYVRISHAFIKPLDQSDWMNELDLAGIQIDPDASFDRLGVQLADIEREITVREQLDQTIIPLFVQRERVDPEDVLKIAISETVNEMIQRLEQAADRFRKIEEGKAKQEQEATQNAIQSQGQQQVQLEDKKHENKIEQTVTAEYAKGAAATMKAKNDILTTRAEKIIEDNAIFDEQSKRKK
jgi:hypothetical protein